MRMRIGSLAGRVAALALLCSWAAPARAGLITYDFTVDTSAVAGQTGVIDFQFNPLGPGGTDTAVVSAFTSAGGALGAGTATGSVTGDLANLPATFTDDSPLNELTHDVTFGSSLQFTLALTTSAGSPGATFALAVFDASGNPLSSIDLLSNPGAVEIDVDAGGSQNPPLTGAGVSGEAEADVATPAPPSAALLAAAGCCLAAYARRRRPAAGLPVTAPG